jgi:hypothetical protein
MPKPTVNIIKRHGFERVGQCRIQFLRVRGWYPRTKVLTFDQQFSIGEKSGE